MTKVWKGDFFVSKEAMAEIDKHWGDKTKAIGDICKECGGPLKHQEGCISCIGCGWSSC